MDAAAAAARATAAEAEDEHAVMNHVTDLQRPFGDEAAEGEASATGPDSDETAAASDVSTSSETASIPAAGDSATASTGLATQASKRRRYRSLFGNIGKLITFNRRKQEPPPSPSADHPAEAELQFPPAPDTVSLDLVVPDSDTPRGDEDPISGQVLELGTAGRDSPQADLLLLHETQADKVGEEGSEAAEQPELASGSGADPKGKMEYDMGIGGISTILEETEEAVKAQDGSGSLFSEADLRKLEAEIDLADFAAPQKRNQDAEAKAKAHGAAEGKAKQSLQSQMSESDSGYGYSTSDSPVEAEVEKLEKPHEMEGGSGGSDVFSKEMEDSVHGKSAMKSRAQISPSEEELASFEKAEACVLDSMVDLGDISVKLDSLIESNSPIRSSRLEASPEKPMMKPPMYGRASESVEEDDDEEVEPVDLDLSSNQAVRRCKFLEAKARRQKELEAARKLQEEALSGSGPADEQPKGEAHRAEAPVRDRDIVDGLGPRRHSHENTACPEVSESGRSRMMSRLPVRRSASCPRRAVEDYATYIRSGSATKKPNAQLIESCYSPVKIDFRPLSRTGPETCGEQLTTGAQQQQQQQQQTTTEPKSGQGQSGKRGSKKVHFNSPTVDQVVTYAVAAPEGDEMKQRDGEENGQAPGKGKQSAIAAPGSRVPRPKSSEAEKSQTQSDESRPDDAAHRNLIKAISVKQTLASRKRLEKLHEDAVKQLGLQDDSQYMTPLQRKDVEVKELKRQLDEAYFVIEQRELELDVFHHEKSKSIDDAVKDREERISCLQVQISQLEKDFACLRAQHSEMCKREKGLAESLDQLKAECAERERRHQDLYLEMYRKGRDSAKFERQDEIEKLAVLEPDKVAMEELLEKLEITQHDLQKWQSIKLKEVYEDSDKSGTEADAKLRFLRDSMFHYLTDKEREQNQQHLMAMIGIFSFTDVQMKHIMKSLDERRKKGKI